jgi:hypothetical protein
MKKIIFGITTALFVFWLYSFLSIGNTIKYFNASTAEAAATTSTVTLTGTVQPYIAIAFNTGSTINFGNISPGVGACSDAPGNANGTIVAITTSAANGYTLAFYDGSDTNSAMVHTDTTTYIPDITGTVATPALWVTGATSGVGVSLYAADTTKEATWGTGTTPCDLFNKWAKAPLAATTGHTVTSYSAGANTSSWGWKVDVVNSQKTGVYSGQVTFSAAPTLP